MGIFSQKAPWYVAGLAFECTGCGRCCAGPEEGYVWLTSDELAAIAEYLELSPKHMRSKYVRKVDRRMSLVERPDNRDCVFLTDGPDGRRVCRIYPVRPRQCRTWPFWPSNLVGPDDWAMTGLRCPGVNRGQLHTHDEIERQRKATFP